MHLVQYGHFKILFRYIYKYIYGVNWFVPVFNFSFERVWYEKEQWK